MQRRCGLRVFGTLLALQIHRAFCIRKHDGKCSCKSDMAFINCYPTFPRPVSHSRRRWISYCTPPSSRKDSWPLKNHPCLGTFFCFWGESLRPSCIHWFSLMCQSLRFALMIPSWCFRVADKQHMCLPLVILTSLKAQLLVTATKQTMIMMMINLFFLLPTPFPNTQDP